MPAAKRIKSANPRPISLQRAFLRQTINLGGKMGNVDVGPNQMAGTQADNRLVITVGEFSGADVFDTTNMPMTHAAIS